MTTSTRTPVAELRLANFRKHVAFNEALRKAYKEANSQRPVGSYAQARARVARELGVTVEEVEAEVARLEAEPYLVQLTPRLVIDEFVLGELGREEMIERLKAWPFTFPGYVHEDGTSRSEVIGITPSTWSQVKRAYLAGEIDQDAFEQIDAASGRPVTAL